MNDNVIIEYFLLDPNVQGHDKEIMDEDTHRFERRKLVTPYENKFADKKYNKKLLDENIYQYVVNRYSDAESFSEALFRIVKKNETRPVCLTCGGKVNFEGLGYGFKDTCCSECRNKLRAERMQIHEKKEKQAKDITDISQINDDVIIEHFFTNKTDRETSKLVNSYIMYEVRGIFGKRSTMNIHIYKYLKNRFKDARSLGETLYMIKNHLTEVMKCPICGDLLPFESLVSGYHKTCSKECWQKRTEISQKNAKEKYIETRTNEHIRIYAEDFGKPVTDDLIKEIFKLWNDDKRSSEYLAYCIYQRGLIPEKEIVYTDVYEYIMNRYSDSQSFRESLYRILNDVDVRPVCKQCGKPVGFLGKKQVWNIFCSEKCQWEYNIAHNLVQGTHTNGNVSKSETNILNNIQERTGLEIIRGYTCDKYYAPNERGIIKQCICDGYIPELDLYIEYQGYYTHGGKPFDGTLNSYNKFAYNMYSRCKEDTANSHIYKWTVNDVCRRECAKYHKLLYLELWDTDRSTNHLNRIIDGINEMKGKSYEEKVKIIQRISKFNTIYDNDIYLGTNEIVKLYESNMLYNIQVPVRMYKKTDYTEDFFNMIRKRNFLYTDGELQSTVLEALHIN